MKITYKDFKKGCKRIITSMDAHGFKPDVIVGLSRGGLVLATRLSYYFDAPLIVINKDMVIPADIDQYWNILVCDDINDTGETLINVYQNIVLSMKTQANVEYCVLVENQSSRFKEFKDNLFYGYTIDKSVNNEWVDFWWEKK